MNNFAFLGFVVPQSRFDELLATEAGMPIATHRFGWSLVRALRAAGNNVIPLSFAPANDFPHNTRVLFRPRHHSDSAGDIRELGFINVTGLKHVSRYFSARRALDRFAREEDLDWVIVHGTNSSILHAAAHVSRHRSFRFAAVLTDPASMPTRFDNRLTLALKKVDRRLITSALGKARAVVVLAPDLASTYAPGIPALWMEGIASASGPSAKAAVPDRFSHLPWDRTVVYAGHLDKRYGTTDLAHAAANTRKGWHVLFLGRGPQLNEVKACESSCDRVTYGGMVNDAELRSIYAQAAALVNPRRLDADFIRFTFPSKLLEYMRSGTPVITTKLPTLPPDFVPHLYLSDHGTEGLMNSIDNFFEIPLQQRKLRSKTAKEFTEVTRSELAQGERITQFLNSLAPSANE